MIYNQTTHEDLRELFCGAVTKVFGNSTVFIDFLENGKYSTKYDCYLDGSGENYIINGETGEYINWYKLTHLGRCITISVCLPYENITKRMIRIWIEDFLTEFKESEAG